jgi:hypothetical protein
VSYVHCPDCSCAYHLGRDKACPRCAVPSIAKIIEAELVDPVADIVIAATQLARALARATPAQRDAARASLGLVRKHITDARGEGFFRPLRTLAAAAAIGLSFVLRR